MMRKKIVAGNWKMFQNSFSIKDFIEDFPPLVADIDDIEHIIFPPFVYLNLFQAQNKIPYGAQNMHFEERGAFTGEISAGMLRDLGCKFVLIGHSERRHIFKETPEMLEKKILAALQDELTPIYCIGEKIEERRSGKTFEVLSSQLRDGLSEVRDLTKVIIAYEPVWAIGTGETATPEIAEEAHVFIRSELETIMPGISEDISVLYGGSVKPENTKELIKMKNIDGFLVGGASLKPETLAQISRFSVEEK